MGIDDVVYRVDALHLIDAGIQVMAKHRQGAIRAFFIGSATNFVANHCKQPVVVLH